MENINLTYKSLFLFFLFTSCAKDQNIPYVAELIEIIVTESQSPADGGTPSIEDLSEAGIQNLEDSQEKYEIAIANANPIPTTLTELQDIINDANGDRAYLGNKELVWSDEFDTGGSPTSSKWTYDIGTGDNGWGNQESQYYTSRSNNVIVEEGLLKIMAKKESYEKADYTSARLKSQGKYNFTYGKVEIRAKLPSAAGTWPALWMLGSNFSSVGWPKCGEIDIMEQKGWDKDKISSALHNQSSSGNTIHYQDIDVPTSTTTFHTYSVNWTPDEIVFSVDGEVYYTYSPENKTEDNWPYNKPQFIILNVAMGGDLGGQIPEDFNESSMQIDYVRVYR
jgi:beta-glucanase (GH16 family)